MCLPVTCASAARKALPSGGPPCAEHFLPTCCEHGVTVLAYSPLGLGVLSGKIGPEKTFPAGDQRSSDPRFAPPNLGRIHGMLDALRPIAERHAISLAQLAIAWVLEQDGVSHALVGARRPAHAQENARAGSVLLTSEDLSAISEIIESLGAGVE